MTVDQHVAGEQGAKVGGDFARDQHKLAFRQFELKPQAESFGLDSLESLRNDTYITTKNTII